MPTLAEALAARHPHHARCATLWQFYADTYEGGPAYPSKACPLPWAAVDVQLAPQHKGTMLYLWQHPIERAKNFQLRLARAVTMNPTQPIIDLYAQTVGRQDLITLNAPKLADFIDDCDRQGQSLIQFLTTCRTNAAVRGHTFILIDSPSTDLEIRTEADARNAGLRPYCTEVLPEDLLNWRIDGAGRISEILFRVACDPEGSLLDSTGRAEEELRYWSTTEWHVYRKGSGDWYRARQGTHALVRVPLVCLYHKRKSPYMGESLMKDSAKIQQLLTNWVSGFDEALANQMFSQLVLKTRKEVEDIGVGTTTVVRLNPEDNEELSYVSPDSAPFEAGWSAYRQMENRLRERMGMKAGAATSDGKESSGAESGIAKAYDFFEAYKIMGQMALNEQEAVKSILELASLWHGAEFAGEVAYSTKYDFTTPKDDVETLVTLQAAAAPPALRRELLRSISNKLLPSLAENTRREIEAEIDDYGDLELTPPDPGATANGKTGGETGYYA